MNYVLGSAPNQMCKPKEVETEVITKHLHECPNNRDYLV